MKSPEGTSESLVSDIRSRISGKVAIVGIGNILRGDDGLGPKLIELLKIKRINASLFDCGTAPENYIFPILGAECDTIILVDAADLGMAPGSSKVLALEDISNVSFSTHNPSPRLFTDLLKTGKDDIKIFIVSMQPKSVKLGAPISEEVSRGLDILAGAFTDSIK